MAEFIRREGYQIPVNRIVYTDYDPGYTPNSVRAAMGDSPSSSKVCIALECGHDIVLYNHGESFYDDLCKEIRVKS